MATKQEILESIYKSEFSASDYADILDIVYSSLADQFYDEAPNQAQHDTLKQLLITRDKVRVFFGPIAVEGLNTIGIMDRKSREKQIGHQADFKTRHTPLIALDEDSRSVAQELLYALELVAKSGSDADGYFTLNDVGMNVVLRAIARAKGGA